MKARSLRTPLVVLGLVVTTVMVLRAADDKSKSKDIDLPSPGTIKFTAAPAAVQKTFKEETKNAKIELLGKGVNELKITYYKAIVPAGANDYEMAVAEDGTLLEKLLHAVRTEINLTDCPPAVQKALKEDAKSAEVEAIERVTAGKRADYIMDIIVQKNRYQVTFSEDGTLMAKLMVYGEDIQQEQAPPQKTSEKPEKGAKKKN